MIRLNNRHACLGGTGRYCSNVAAIDAPPPPTTVSSCARHRWPLGTYARRFFASRHLPSSQQRLKLAPRSHLWTNQTSRQTGCAIRRQMPVFFDAMQPHSSAATLRGCAPLGWLNGCCPRLSGVGPCAWRDDGFFQWSVGTTFTTCTHYGSAIGSISPCPTLQFPIATDSILDPNLSTVIV